MCRFEDSLEKPVLSKSTVQEYNALQMLLLVMDYKNLFLKSFKTVLESQFLIILITKLMITV
jgi:hypothetical protein